MKLWWTSKARDDLARLHEFLAPVNPRAAAKAVRALTRVPRALGKNPRMGELLDAYAPREVRRLLVGQYELRYEVRLQEQDVVVLRVWHTREHR
ncbi:MAG: type II toxin-antitoxin system RelE/ParE family toxin [Deltaproteobacteria bacterium]|nr:type II toxin-antitoxin system RelE/ParE family toxin [Deltaproteobacteria bacterium]